MTQYTNVANLGNYILLRAIEDGKRVCRREQYKPTLFIEQKKDKPTKWKSLESKSLEPLKFPSIKESREFVKKYGELDQFKIYGQTSYQYAYIAQYFGKKHDWKYENIVVGTIDIEVGSDDGFPKPEHAFAPITAITLHIKNIFDEDCKNGKYFVFGCGDYNNTRHDVEYKECLTEKDLIEEFLLVWEYHYPDIITGWNIQKFDFPYIVNRMKRIFLEEDIPRLSPWGKVQEREVYGNKFDKEKIPVYELYGISIIDYIDLYKKHSSKASQESYSLDHIAHVELKESKIDYSEHTNLYTLYKNDYQKFIDYNINDVTLVNKIDNKTGLLDLAITLAYDNKVNFNDIFFQVRMWDSIIYNELYQNGIIVPPKKHNRKTDYPGGHVKEPKPGRVNYPVGYDLDGLYPHLIMMYNLGPETLIDPAALGDEFYNWYVSNNFSVESLLNKRIDTSILKKYNVTLTPNGQIFSRDKQGFLARLMQSMYADRKKFKDQMIKEKKNLVNAISSEIPKLEKQISMLNNFQAAKKVTLNSAYGAIGNEYFRFFDIRIAAAVTTSGQLAVQWVQRDMNNFLNKLAGTVGVDYIVASDTDSMYMNLEFIVKNIPNHKEMKKIDIIRYIDNFCKNSLDKEIKKSFKELDDYVNSFDSKMNMKREAISDTAIWTGKKHYIMNVWNMEGVEYTEPQLKVVGLEAIKAATLSVDIREKIMTAYKIIINNDIEELRSFIETFKSEYLKFSVEKISNPRGCNGLTKYYDSEKVWGLKTPFHVKGALIYNNLLKIKGLDKKYPEIKEGEKIRYVYLKEPNPTGSNVLSFPHTLPKEFDLHRYIDYNTQFEKSFIKPVESVMETINWKLEEEYTLDAFFK